MPLTRSICPSANIATDKVRIATTANSILFAVGYPNVSATGTVTTLTNSKTVTGVSTVFLSEVDVGWWIGNATGTTVGGWPASEMRTYVNSDIYNVLPTTLKNAIIDTTVVSGHGDVAGETNFTSTDKLYLLSTKEVGFDVIYDSTAETITVW